MKEGWKKVKLMDNCSVTTGKNDANHAVDNGRYRFYTCASEYLYCNTYKYDGACIILPGNGANVGDVYFYEGKFDAYQRTYVIDNISPKVLPFYLYYQLQYGWKTYGVAKQYGSATNYIKIGNFKDYEFLCPDIDTQKEIVEYLDSSFAKIDKLKENAAKNLEEAKALFQSALKNALEPKEGWEEKTLGELGSLKNGMNFTKNESGTELHILGVGDFGNLFSISNTENLPIISLNEIPSDDYMLENEDIVFVRSNGNKNLVGRCVLVYPNNIKTSFSGFCIRFRKNSSKIDAKYLTYFLKAPNTRKEIAGNGANISNLNQKVLQSLAIPFPSLPEQQSIVSHLDSLNEKLNTLQQNYSRICDECDALKQAILRQVFE